MSCPRRFDIGVYVLGALAPEERATVAEHLGTCEDCSRELRLLGGLPGLLARAPEPAIEDASGARPEPEHRPELLTALMGRRVRARRRQLAMAAVAALGLLGGGVALGSAVTRETVTRATGTRETGTSATGTRALPPGAVQPGGTAVRTIELLSPTDVPGGEAGLSSRPWGTAIALRCHSRGTTGPAPAGTAHTLYVLLVRGPDGAMHPIARWSPPPGQDVDVQAASDLTPAQISGLEVRSGDGQVVLQS